MRKPELAVAQSAAGSRIIANEISVQPVGAASEAKDEAAALDQGIEKNYKAALISSHLDKQHIDYGTKNGVLTLTGSVHTSAQRKLATGRSYIACATGSKSD